MAKPRKTTWRSGSGWWDSPPVSQGGYTGNEVLSTTAEPKDALPKKRKRPRFKTEQARAQAAQARLRLQKLLLRARGSMIANPKETAQLCLEALDIKPKGALGYRDRSGKTYRQIFTGLLEDAERSLARKKRLEAQPPQPHRGK
ncbi:hypothetical protein [Nocardiopsis sp. FR26]|uniref:hypothetical protein n=1 Tax=Nocardiopsis sp. FR26 TaxID=2605987 RepID=UPI00135BA609|nr:hypothetical protein [Nocardiopsis sp. FR26]